MRQLAGDSTRCMVSVMGVLNEGQLIALIRGVEWEPDIAGSTVVHPPPWAEGRGSPN